MDRGTAVILTALVGGLVALQAPINSGLGRTIGTFQGAFVSFVIGTIFLAGIVVLHGGGFGGLAQLRHVQWYYLFGGFCGAAYVSTVLVTIRALGAGPVTAATISGQLTMSLVIDQFGLLGVQKDPITALKVVGVLLLAAGTFLLVRD